MALIVEDGSIVADAESYVTVSAADAYHAARGNALWTGDDTVKEAALRKAADFMTQAYRGAWKGYRTNSAQALDWPRQLVLIEDGPSDAYIDMNTIPTEVKRAQMQLALTALGEELSPNLERGVKREKVAEIEVEYEEGSPEGVRFTAVDAILGPLLKGSSVMVKLVR